MKIQKVDKIWKVKIPISSGKESRGFKFVGALEIITDELNIIYDWKIIANKINIDRMCNRTWDTKKPLAWKIREELFRTARIDRQFDRPVHHTISSDFITQPVKISDGTIQIVVDFLNNEETFKRHHIMHLPEVFSGEIRSLPEAYAKNELLYTDFHGKQIPISIILKDHVINREENEIQNIEDIIGDALLIGEIDFETWAETNMDSIGLWADMLANVENSKEALTKVGNKIVKDATKHFTKANKANEVVARELEKFQEQIVETYGHSNTFFNVEVVEEDQFGESFIVQEKFENTHIYPIWQIKKDIVNAKNKAEHDEAVSMIADIENFLPLNKFTRQLFERGDIYYDESGYLKVLFKSIGRAKAAYGYHQIAKKDLTDLRRWYLAKHRDLHTVDPFIVIAEQKEQEELEIAPK